MRCLKAKYLLVLLWLIEFEIAIYDYIRPRIHPALTAAYRKRDKANARLMAVESPGKWSL